MPVQNCKRTHKLAFLAMSHRIGFVLALNIANVSDEEHMLDVLVFDVPGCCICVSEKSIPLKAINTDLQPRYAPVTYIFNRLALALQEHSQFHEQQVRT